jgi:hypothetical protein
MPKKLLTEPQPSDGKALVVLELENLLGIAHRHEALLDQVEAQRLVLRRVVLGNRVVEIHADVLDLLQMQRAIHEYSGMMIMNINVMGFGVCLCGFFV